MLWCIVNELASRKKTSFIQSAQLGQMGWPDPLFPVQSVIWPRIMILYIWLKTYFWHWNRVWRIYSNIWIFKYIGNKYLFGHTFVSIFIYKFIWTFVRIKLVCTNIFGHSFVSLWKLVKTFIQFSILIFIRAFICVKFFIQIYSDIHSCKFIDTNIIGYSLVF